jgi:CheY-like chemotaxis protein
MTAAIPVVIVSIVDERGKGFALGASEYLVKPVGRDELVSAVRRVARLASADTRRLTVLAVDDDPLVLELMEAVLGPEGFSVMKAGDGTIAIRLAREHRPNLIVLDLMMPVVDGFQVLDDLKRDPATADIPIVVLTCKTLAVEDRARLNGRICDLKQKGEFSRAEFVSQVRSLLQPRLM